MPTDFWMSLCGDTENETLMLNSSVPHVNACAANIVLTWPASAILFLGSMYQIYFLVFSPSRGRLKWTRLLGAKLLINFILFAITSATLSIEFVRIIKNDNTNTGSTLASILLWLCMMTLLILTEANRRRGRRSSGVLWTTWFSFVICGFIQFSRIIAQVSSGESNRSMGLRYYQEMSFLVCYLLFIVMLVLHSFADVFERGRTSNRKECPEYGSSFFNRITYSWFVRTVVLGYKRPLTQDDVWQLRDKDAAEALVRRWSKIWDSALKKRKLKNQPPQESRRTSIPLSVFKTSGAKVFPVANQAANQSIKYQECPSLMLNIFKFVKWELIPTAACKLSADLLFFVSPQILKLLLAFIDEPETPLLIGIFYALLMFFANTVQAIMQTQSLHRMFATGMNLRSALSSCVYKKALRLSTTSRRDTTVGEMVNLMAADVQRVGDVVQWIQQLWPTPITIGIGLYFLYGELGYSALVGFCVMLILMPCNFLLSKYLRQQQVKMMGIKDKRMKLMNEILNGMKVLKLYAWEEPFEKKVIEIRNDELDTLKRGSYFDAINAFTLNCAPFLVAVASFSTFVLSSPSHILTPSKAFVSLSLFNILRQPINQLPNVVSAIVQAMVSNTRMKNFLSLSEINPDLVLKNGNQAEAIVIEKGTFAWSEIEEQSVLKDINFLVKPGQLVAVVGPVGCGKSSLLSAILGDMEPRGGAVSVKGSAAYVPQQAWIQSQTLRNNVTFTKPYSEDLYANVVDACALRPDFEILPNGDITEIGDKGINLSGGQKQRVSLARAIYQDRDIYLLDDPLSAVDAHVGRHIFDKAIGNNGLLKGKTRVFVTHGLTYLKYVDNIFVMKGGRISQSGTLAELLRQDGPFAEFLQIYLTKRCSSQEGTMDDEAYVNDIVEELEKVNPNIIEGIRKLSVSSGNQVQPPHSRRQSAGEAGPVSGKRNGVSKKEHKEKQPNKHPDSGQVVQPVEQKLGRDIKQEKVQKGQVQWRIYKDYIRATGYISFLVIFMAFVTSSALGVGMNLWLSEWSTDSNKPLNESTNVDIRLAVYASLGVGQAFFIFCAAFIGVRFMVLASAKLHQLLLHTLMRLPMSFYDVTPQGAVISRIGKDVEIMDGNLPQNFRMWILQSLNLVSSIVIIMISTPYVGIAVVPLGLLYYFLQKFYIATFRQLRRLEFASRGPLYSHFGESLSGVSSIRAYCVEGHFIGEAHYRLDEMMKSTYAQIIAGRWLSITLQFIGNILILFAALFAVLGRNSGIDPGLVALSISFAMTITNTLQMSVRVSSDLESNIVAVERINEYIELKTEAPWITNIRPPPDWPTKGVIDFDRLQLRYRENQPLILKGIDWHVDAKEKCGVVGRTGAGKSSMALALFRIVEAAEGRILIDGIDISKIGLHDLRSRLAIIPQDPVLFSGALRVNLDPVGDHNDTEIWAALEQAHLKSFVAQLNDGLEYKVTEGGENLSVGQRQLLCLARALLHHSRILILDEATAAVDLATESLILETIRNRLSDCTVITIAHRINTIMDNDKILVLSRGAALEHGTPEALLSDHNSAFFSMATQRAREPS